MSRYDILQGDASVMLATLEPESVQTCVTSPPYYGIRDYGVDGQIGHEESPEEYVAALVEVFRQVRRVLKPDGTLWLNLGDTYAGGGGFAPNAPINVARQQAIAQGNRREGAFGLGSAEAGAARVKPRPGHVPAGLKPKDLIGIPWRVAFALQADGWYLRSEIIWHKPSCMPESATDRPTRAHEHVFLLSTRPRYFYDAEAIAEPAVKGAAGSTFTEGKTGINGMGRVSQLEREERDTRNARDVWSIATSPFDGAHFATMPPELARRCILAGSREGDTVLDCFNGAATTGVAALETFRNYVGIELNPEYIEISRRRLDPIACQPGLFEEVAA
jgi:DNA modification methylase